MNRFFNKISIFLITVVLIIYSIVLYFLTKYFDGKTPEELTFFDNVGSWYGGIFGAVFGFLTLVFIVLTYQLTIEQKKEQEKQVRKQSFENTFFQLISLHISIVDSITFPYSQDENASVGRKSFYFFYEELKHFYNRKCSLLSKPDLPDEVIQLYLAEIYKDFFIKHQSQIGHYFRNLYHIVKFIDEAVFLNKDEKIGYIRFLRAQLSSYEMLLLFYNLQSQWGKEFNPLAEKYRLLQFAENDFEFLIHESHKIFFDFKVEYDF
ncbi:putative phage abortive infection protein [Brevibacillus laterosporus]|uniref:putative phage abortive infection protein n=1 Tax=Brevibacillus laterosporus TaxID=1465 RepID=UPI001EF3C4E2|nr:putative phage abortive infection protein [Brevibacillus laterosporus]MCG7320186.1 putative phage abortive infection protein [Brevibacillus laterosporus]